METFSSSFLCLRRTVRAYRISYINLNKELVHAYEINVIEVFNFIKDISC